MLLRVLQSCLPFFEIWRQQSQGHGHGQGQNPTDTAPNAYGTYEYPPWGFSYYFDDSVNFSWLKVGEQTPPATTATYLQIAQLSLKRMSEILTRSDLNVFEPLGNLLKAAQVAVLGLNGQSLRCITLLTHCCNAVLLANWLRLLTATQGPGHIEAASAPSRSRCASSNKALTVNISSLLVASLWLLHPLHAEVLGWLSAQHYTFCLFFSLLSNIQLEKAVQETRVRALEDCNRLQLYWHSGAALGFYIAACCCKAPALVLPLCQGVRLCLLLRSAAASTAKGANSRYASLGRLVWPYLTASLLCMALCAKAVLSANADSVMQYPEYTSLAAFLLGSVMRVLSILWAHIGRSLRPIGLCVIYPAPPAFQHFYTMLPEFVSWHTLPGDDCQSVSPSPSPPIPWSSPELQQAIAEVAGGAVLVIYVTIACCAHAAHWERRVRVSSNSGVLLFGWLSYLLMWAPGCGLVQHGLDVFGADRYNYLPLALGACPMLWRAVCIYLRIHDSGDEDCGGNAALPLPLPLFLSKLQGKCGDVAADQGKDDGGSVVAKDTDTDTDTEQEQQRERERKESRTRLCILAAVAAPILLWHAALTNARLHLWRSDQLLLESCIHAYPSSKDCHFFLAEFHGYHGKDSARGEFHRQQVLRVILPKRDGTPRSSGGSGSSGSGSGSNALNQDHRHVRDENHFSGLTQNDALFAAKLLIHMQRSGEACELVTFAQGKGVSAGGPRRQAHSNYAMALNDYVICLALSPVSAITPVPAAATAAAAADATATAAAAAAASAGREHQAREALRHSGLSQHAVHGYILALQEVLTGDAEAGHQLLMPRVRVRIEDHVEKLKLWKSNGTGYDAKFLY